MPTLETYPVAVSAQTPVFVVLDSFPNILGEHDASCPYVVLKLHEFELKVRVSNPN